MQYQNPRPNFAINFIYIKYTCDVYIGNTYIYVDRYISGFS